MTRICLCSLAAAVVLSAGCGRVAEGGVNVTTASGAGTAVAAEVASGVTGSGTDFGGAAVGDGSSVSAGSDTSGSSVTTAAEPEPGGHMGGTATGAASAVASTAAVHGGVEDMNADSGVIPYTTAAGDLKDHITVDIDFVGVISDIDELDSAERVSLPPDGVLVLNAEVTAVTPLEAVEKACKAADLGIVVKDGGVSSVGGLANGDIDGAAWRIIVNGRIDSDVLKQPLKKGDNIRVSYAYSIYN